jgi:hypothetical protein
VQTLAAWFVPAAKFQGPITVKTGRADAKMPAISRLKIMREFDSTASPACAGRMAISGRMADVCAELERMAQRETTAH